MGAGRWAAIPEARRPSIAGTMAHVPAEFRAVFEEPTPLQAFAALDVPALCLVGSESRSRLARCREC